MKHWGGEKGEGEGNDILLIEAEEGIILGCRHVQVPFPRGPLFIVFGQNCGNSWRCEWLVVARELYCFGNFVFYST